MTFDLLGAGRREQVDAVGDLSVRLSRLSASLLDRARRLVDLAALAVVAAGQVLRPGVILSMRSELRASAALNLSMLCERAVERLLVVGDEDRRACAASRARPA